MVNLLCRLAVFNLIVPSRKRTGVWRHPFQKVELFLVTYCHKTYANMLFISDNRYSVTLRASYRGQGNSCRGVLRDLFVLVVPLPLSTFETASFIF
jgi:hypothetical protein